ncbi:MAG: hypothetical protein ACOYM3_17670, partial [Terrimicrobiaceae bacterium]
QKNSRQIEQGFRVHGFFSVGGDGMHAINYSAMNLIFPQISSASTKKREVSHFFCCVGGGERGGAKRQGNRIKEGVEPHSSGEHARPGVLSSKKTSRIGRDIPCSQGQWGRVCPAAKK